MLSINYVADESDLEFSDNFEIRNDAITVIWSVYARLLSD